MIYIYILQYIIYIDIRYWHFDCILLMLPKSSYIITLDV